jgi:UTP:GlnB (protein PII) uridylyltransferase
VGDPVVARAFEERIRAPLFGPRRNAFVTDVLHELSDRRRTPPRGLNIKLGPGGLREIHLLWLAIRVVAQLPAPLSDALLPEAIRALPQAAEDLLALMDANRELRRIRDLYRLVVAIDDAMEPAAVVELARDLEPLRLAGFGEGFEERLHSRLADTAARVDRVATILRRQLARSRR